MNFSRESLESRDRNFPLDLIFSITPMILRSGLSIYVGSGARIEGFLVWVMVYLVLGLGCGFIII